MKHTKQHYAEDIWNLLERAQRCSHCGNLYILYHVKMWVEAGIAKQRIPLLANVCSWKCVDAINRIHPPDTSPRKPRGLGFL